MAKRFSTKYYKAQVGLILGSSHLPCTTFQCLPTSTMNTHITILKLVLQAFVLTFLAYTLFHATRKPPSIVKSVLKGDVHSGSSKAMLAEENYGWSPFNAENGKVSIKSIHRISNA